MSFPREMIVESNKKCCICNAMDYTKDNYVHKSYNKNSSYRESNLIFKGDIMKLFEDSDCDSEFEEFI